MQLPNVFEKNPKDSGPAAPSFCFLGMQRDFREKVGGLIPWSLGLTFAKTYVGWLQMPVLRSEGSHVPVQSNPLVPAHSQKQMPGPSLIWLFLVPWSTQDTIWGVGLYRSIWQKDGFEWSTINCQRGRGESKSWDVWNHYTLISVQLVNCIEEIPFWLLPSSCSPKASKSASLCPFIPYTVLKINRNTSNSNNQCQMHRTAHL